MSIVDTTLTQLAIIARGGKSVSTRSIEVFNRLSNPPSTRREIVMEADYEPQSETKQDQEE